MNDYLTSVTSDGLSLSDVPDQFRTHEICLAAVQREWTDVRYVPEHITSTAIYKAAMQQDGSAYKLMSEASLRRIVESVTQDMVREALAAVQYDGRMLRRVPEEFRTNKLCVAAVLQNAEALQYCPAGVDLSSIRPDAAEERSDWEAVKAGLAHLLSTEGDRWVDKWGLYCYPNFWTPVIRLTQILCGNPTLKRMQPIDAAVRILPRRARLFLNPAFDSFEKILEVS